MNTQLITPLTGLLFILVFGGLSAVRGQRISLQFALEGLALTAIATALIFLAGIAVSPIFFLTVIYLITMRTRWLVDLGNLLSQRRRHSAALRAFDLAQHLWPDPVGRMLARIGSGVAHLNAGGLDRAITVLQEVVGEMPEGISSRYEAGCRYNLGLAYRRAGREEEANLEFRRVLAADQNSLFATGARAALRQSPPAAEAQEEETASPEPPVGHR